MNIFGLPNSWALCAVNGDKKPFHPDQQFVDGKPDPSTPDWKQPLPRDRFSQLNGRLRAVGLLTGRVSGGIVALDHDGELCDPLIEQISGQPLKDALPKSVAVTSGRPGRCQILYRIPDEFLDCVSGKVILTGVNGSDGKPEQLDFRWNGQQSVILGEHPETRSYRWVDGCSPQETDVEIAPLWVVRQMLSFSHLMPQNRKEWTDKNWALSYIGHIKNNDLEWHKWRNILFALHHSDVDEYIARLWSQTSEKHDDKGFDDVWKHIKDDKSNPITVAYLGQLAKDNGWKGKQPRDHWHPPTPEDSKPKSEIDTEELSIEIRNRFAEFDIKTLFHPKVCRQLEQIARVFNQP
ncbi:MAG: bifunctional DNA primase/polymerase, partial [Thermosynechococcaceae cyanobacterium]